jgi:SAM-dependent methyltransferase
MALDEYRSVNRDNWDSRVDIHYRSETYGVERFIADPSHLSDVVAFDRTKLGDVSGKDLLHLQCHIGTDTISWARLGANVTGIDFSEKAIDAARKLSAESKTPARFIISELYETPETLSETFDIVYTGVGAINWLPDIRGWARVVSRMLRSGGTFYIRDGHPLMYSLDWDDPEKKLSLIYSYFEDEPNSFEDEATYAGEGVVTSPKTFDWNHGIGETLTALIDAGLRIDRVEEYEFCEWQATEEMVLDDDRHWRLPPGRPRIPLMWSILATKI